MDAGMRVHQQNQKNVETKNGVDKIRECDNRGQ